LGGIFVLVPLPERKTKNVPTRHNRRVFFSKIHFIGFVIKLPSYRFTDQVFFLISYFIFPQVVTVQDYWVKPRSADINENVLSEQAREEMGLSEELIRTKGNSLEQVLSQVKAAASSQHKNRQEFYPPGKIKRKKEKKTCWVTLTHALSKNSLCWV
jgi:hypothetical protein